MNRARLPCLCLCAFGGLAPSCAAGAQNVLSHEHLYLQSTHHSAPYPKLKGVWSIVLRTLEVQYPGAASQIVVRFHTDPHGAGKKSRQALHWSKSMCRDTRYLWV